MNKNKKIKDYQKEYYKRYYIEKKFNFIFLVVIKEYKYGRLLLNKTHQIVRCR